MRRTRACIVATLRTQRDWCRWLSTIWDGRCNFSQRLNGQNVMRMHGGGIQKRTDHNGRTVFFFTRCDAFTLSPYTKVPTPRPCLLRQRPKVQPTGFALSFCPRRFRPRLLFRGSCATASVPEVLSRGFSPEQFSLSFCRTCFSLRGAVSQVLVLEVLSQRFCHRYCVPTVLSLLFYPSGFVSASPNVWAKPMKSAEQSPNTHE